jgi:hypothetical protein
VRVSVSGLRPEAGSFCSLPSVMWPFEFQLPAFVQFTCRMSVARRVAGSK